MSSTLKSNSAVEDYRIKSNRLCIPFTIVFNATPASKVVSNDLSAACYVVTEGLTAAAAAVDSGTSFTTPVDATGIFGVLIANCGTVKKLTKVSVEMLSAGTVAVTLKGASSSGVTASGNIAFSVDSDQNLATTSLSGTIVVDFQVSKE